MAQINEKLTFRFRLYDLDGLPANTTTVVAEVIDPKGKPTPVVLLNQGTGIYVGTFVCEKEGEHWVRVETSGGIETAIQKKFNVAERKVVIGA